MEKEQNAQDPLLAVPHAAVGTSKPVVPYPAEGLSASLINPLSRSAKACYKITEVTCLIVLFFCVASLFDWSVSFFPFLQSVWNEWYVTPQSVLCFGLLSAALLFYNRQPLLLRSKIIMTASGSAIALCTAIYPLAKLLKMWGKQDSWPFLYKISPWFEYLSTSPITLLAMSVISVSAACLPSVMRRHKALGDVMGVAVFAVLTSYTLFLLSYLQGTPRHLIAGYASPPFFSVCVTVLMGIATVARLGPGYFPIRPLVGPSVKAVLFRKILPVTFTGMLMYSLLGRSILAFMNPALASYIAILLSILIMTLVVLRASSMMSHQLEEALKESEKLYSGLVASLEDLGVVLLDAQGQIILWNSGAERVTGYRAEQVVGEQISRILSHAEPDFESSLPKAMAQGFFQTQGWMERRDGVSFWMEITLNPIQDEQKLPLGFSLVVRDLTQQKKASDRLESSLKEKEVMLKEIHHRVKNNLQVISSLLRMQSENITDKRTLSLFTDSQERVRAMAMVHEYLYQSKDLAHIQFTNYVMSLVRSLSRTYNPNASDLDVQIDQVQLSLDMAVPCGLIIAELVANAFKYAYPNQKSGPIQVNFKILPDGRYELIVADQGVGLPKDLDWENTSSLGLRLVQLLAKQLQGSARLENEKGAKFIITFKGPDEGSGWRKSK